jgi:hypothetical protein
LLNTYIGEQRQALRAETQQRADAKEAQERADAKEAQERADAKEAQERADAKEAQERADAKEAQERADAKEARERADAKEAQERADAKEANVREDKLAYQAREERLAKEAHEREIELTKLKSGAKAKSTSKSTSIASTPSEVYNSTHFQKWEIPFASVVHACKDYVAAPETDVRSQMITFLKPIATSVLLQCHDKHATTVPGLHKPDAVLTRSGLRSFGAPAVAFLAEFKARNVVVGDGVAVFTFPSEEKGKVIDKLSRLRAARPGADLHGMLSNGYHYQLFKFDDNDAFHESNVFTLHDVGPLKTVLKLAADSMAKTLFFVQVLQQTDMFKSMDVRSLLGFGRHCPMWEFGNDGRQVAVVVAETPQETGHLLHGFNVFLELSNKAQAADRTDPLYSPLFVWSEVDKSKAFAVFDEVGERWTKKMFDENKLTVRDFSDVLGQIEFFHKCGFIHADVASRNFVQVTKNGVLRSILIDASSAVRIGTSAWLGGTVVNGALSWLASNLEHINEKRYSEVVPPSKQDELWSFVFAVIDLCFPNMPEGGDILEFRKSQVKRLPLSKISALIDNLQYDQLAAAVADLVCAPLA